MKKILFIYNIIFLFIGNSLLSNIHFMHDHKHDHEHEIVECEECITIENSKNYDLDNNEVKISKLNISLFFYEFSNIIKFNKQRQYLSRAPPIS